MGLAGLNKCRCQHLEGLRGCPKCGQKWFLIKPFRCAKAQRGAQVRSFSTPQKASQTWLKDSSNLLPLTRNAFQSHLGGFWGAPDFQAYPAGKQLLCHIPPLWNFIIHRILYPHIVLEWILSSSNFFPSNEVVHKMLTSVHQECDPQYSQYFWFFFPCSQIRMRWHSSQSCPASIVPRFPQKWAWLKSHIILISLKCQPEEPNATFGLQARVCPALLQWNPLAAIISLIISKVLNIIHSKLLLT